MRRWPAHSIMLETLFSPAPSLFSSLSRSMGSFVLWGESDQAGYGNIQKQELVGLRKRWNLKLSTTTALFMRSFLPCSYSFTSWDHYSATMP